MGKRIQNLKKRGPVFFIGMIIVSVLIFLLVLYIGDLVAMCLRRLISPGVGVFGMIVYAVLAVAAFVFSLLRMTKAKFRTLKNYYLLSSVIALTVVFAVLFALMLIASMFGNNLIDIMEKSVYGDVLAVMILCTVLFLSIAIFLIIFNLLTKRKSQYVKYISSEVKKISEIESAVYINELGDDEISSLCHSINKMTYDLRENRMRQKKLEEQKNELISNVSHDLRSPLTSIIGYVKLLEENGCKNEEKFGEYIEVIDRRLGDLNKLINELFELTKLDAVNFELNLCDTNMTCFLMQFGYEMGEILAQSGLRLTLAVDSRECVMMLDIERFNRVMGNLFSNVRKYAVAESEVRLSSEVLDNEVHICLSNAVKSDSDIDVENMFNRFYKADKSRTDTESSGLGLAIAKKIVELHGGNISASLEENIITVRIVLPVR